MIESVLLQYGALGVFVLYLIYDRQVILKEVVESIKTNTAVTQSLKEVIEKEKN